MTLSRSFRLCLLAAALVVLPQPAAAAPAAKKAAPTETTLEVKAKLDAFARAHINKCNATLVPSRTAMSVKKEKGRSVARYLEVDPTTLTTEIYEGKTPGSRYLGHIVYLEKTYESVGKTKGEAESGPFKAVKARRVRELTSYDKGAWRY